MREGWNHLSDDEWARRETELVNAVYDVATRIFERMERADELFGNGHHAAQAVAQMALGELRSRRPPRKPGT